MSDPQQDRFTLDATGLGKAYREGSGEALRVLENIDFSVRAGESIAIMGSSGSGKSTLLNLLGALDQPTAGDVTINGRSLFSMDEKSRCLARNRHLGFVYQFHHLLPEFTALENVAMPQLIGAASPQQAAQRAQDLLREVGLGKRVHHKPGELSGGERQRAAIARALINSPDCVLADEPTGNLDRRNAENVTELILDLNREFHTGIVIVTHDAQLAERMEIVYLLEDGVLERQ